MDKDALIRAIDAAEEDSYGADNGDELSASRAAALEAYLGENTDPAPEGRSQVVDRTLFEVVESVLPSIVRIFASGDDVVKVLPVGPDDIDGADQTTALLQWTVTQKNNWEQIVHDWSKDALLLRNGYAMCYWDKSERVEREIYEGQSDEQIAMLMQEDNVRVLQHSQKPDEDTDQRNAQQYQQMMQQYQMQAAQAMQTGQQPPPPPQPPQPAFLHDVVIERVENEGKVCIKVLPPEHCKVAVSTPDYTLAQCDYFEYWQEKTISDLRSMGLDVPDDIGENDEDDTEEDDARNRFNEDWRGESQGVDPAMRRVRCRMIWIRTDAEGDGIARLYYVLRVGNELLHVEPVSRIPVASITPLPLPHRHIGLGMWDILEDIQKTKQAVIRSALDNLYLSVNGRTAVSDQVNLEDLLQVRPGGVVRMNSGALPGEGHIMPLQHPFAFDQIISTLNYFDQSRQNISGVNSYFNGVDQGALNRTATGLSMMTTQSAQRVEQVARMFSTGVEYLFSCVLELIQKHANKEQIFSLRGKWYAVNPLAWSTKRDIKISVGVGAGNKDAMLVQLQQMFAAQTQVGMAIGIADPKAVYNTASEIAKMQGFAQPERFWVDPSQRPPQPPQPPPEIVKAQMQIQSDQQKTQVDATIKSKQIDTDAQLKKYEIDKVDERERWRTVFEAQVQAGLKEMDVSATKELKYTELGSSRELENVRMQREDARTSQDKQKEEAVQNLWNQVGELQQAIQNVVRQLGNKVSGIERVRGPDGRMVGARIKRANGEVEDVPIQ